MMERKNYRDKVKRMGKKEFTLLKMQEFGFWPKNLPTPYERQKNETPEDYQKRKELLKEYDKIAGQIAASYEEKDIITQELAALRKQYNETWDYDKIRKEVSRKIMEESIQRRAENKKRKEAKKQAAREAWNLKKSEEIVFIGKGYSSGLSDKQCDIEKLNMLGLPILENDKSIATLLSLEYKELRFLAYHRDVVMTDHYNRFSVPKKSGGERYIAAPKTLLKNAQKNILEKILEKLPLSEEAHGFVKGKSVVTGANTHMGRPVVLINMDVEDFFPTITFERVRGMFQSFGYSGYVASILAMLCTYCERMPVEVKGQTRYVKTSARILPQGSSASPAITNIICRNMDKRLRQLSMEFGSTYTRYADDMSFSFYQEKDGKTLGQFAGRAATIVRNEGFAINNKKTCFLRENNRQSVTGIVINNTEFGVPKEWVKKMRAAVFNAKKKKESGEDISDRVNKLSGMASWLKSVNYDRYKKLIDEAYEIINS